MSDELNDETSAEATGLDANENDEAQSEKTSFDALIPGLVRRVISQGAEVLSDEKIRETLVSEVVRKAIDKGHEVVDQTEGSVRRIVGELPVAKDAADRLANRLDDYRSELYRIVGEETRNFLDKVDLGHELQRALTSLSLEISTEIRFIPNDKNEIKPDVKHKTKVKRAGSERKRNGEVEAEITEAPEPDVERSQEADSET